MFEKLDLHKFIDRVDKGLSNDLLKTPHPRLEKIAVRIRARFPTFLNKSRIKPDELMEWTKAFAQALDQMAGELGDDDTIPEAIYVKYADLANTVRGLGTHHTTTIIRDLQERGLPYEQARDFAHSLVALNNQYPTTFSKLRHPGHFVLKYYDDPDKLAEYASIAHGKFIGQF